MERDKIRKDLYVRSMYCSVTDYEINQVKELVEFWGVNYDDAIEYIARRLRMY
jgi:archaellum biogenesis protein FlaJ (TadC family)